jgi:signal peptidase I
MESGPEEERSATPDRSGNAEPPEIISEVEPEATPEIASPSPTEETEPNIEFFWSSDTSSPIGFSPWAMPDDIAVEAPVEMGPSLRLRLGRFARDAVETLILALLIFIAVRAAVQNFRVQGASMEGSLHDGQYLLVSKATYFKVNLGFLDFLPFYDSGNDPYHYVFREPHRGDVVVFRFPDDPSRDFIKRIIAEPGETVEIRDGLVFIDGRYLKEPYITVRAHYSYGPEKVPPDHYFVLGDNRNNSFDSHVWGMLAEESIIGQAWLSYWPFSSFGLISSPHIKPAGSEPAPTSVEEMTPTPVGVPELVQ